VIDAEYLDLGVLWEDQEQTRTLPVRNRTDRDIEVLDFQSSCSCLGVEPKALTVPSGGRADIRVKLHAPRGPAREDGPDLWDFQAQVLPVVKEGFLAQWEWKLSGRVRRAVTIRPARVEFAGPLIRGTTWQAEKVTAKPLVAAKDLRVQCDERSVSVQVTRKGDDYELAVAPAAGLACGRLTSEVSVQVVPETGEEIPPRKFGVTGLVCENIQAVPASLLFGPRRVGAVLRESAVLHALRPEEFDVEGIDTPSDDVAVEASQGGPSAGGRFVVRQKVTRQGPQEATVQFIVRRADGSRLRVPLAVSCYGLTGEGEALRGGLR
jgi:hypothetical protein